MPMTNFPMSLEEVAALAQLSPENGKEPSPYAVKKLLAAASRAHAWVENLTKPVTVETTKEPA